jgi:hypothetical protein
MTYTSQVGKGQVGEFYVGSSLSPSVGGPPPTPPTLAYTAQVGKAQVGRMCLGLVPKPAAARPYTSQVGRAQVGKFYLGAAFAIAPGGAVAGPRMQGYFLGV